MLTRLARRASYLPAVVALRVGSHRTAAALFDFFLAAVPNHVGALHHSGWVLAQLARFEESLQRYQRLRGLLPSSAVAHLGIAIALQQLGRHEEAIPAFNTALDADPENHVIQYNLARSLVAIGDVQDALVLYRRLVRLNPSDAEAAGNLAAALGELGHWPEALEEAKHAMSLQPSAIHARNLGVASFECDDFAGAAAAFRVALKFDPGSHDLQVRLATALAQQGEHDEAIMMLREVRVQSPQNHGAVSSLVVALVLACRVKEAVDVASRFAKENPALSLAYETCGWAYLKDENAVEALRAYERAISLDPETIELHAGRGAALSLAGRHEDALREFDFVLSHLPDYLERYPDFASHLATSRAALSK